MTGDAGSCGASIASRMAISTGSGPMHSSERKFRLTVVERGRQPSRGRMTNAAIVIEIILHVIGINHAAVIGSMA